MPSHCIHDCACACERKIVYVHETDEERAERKKKEQEKDRKVKEKNKQRKIDQIRELKKEIALLEESISEE